MSASLAISNPTQAPPASPPPPRGVLWIDVASAAARSGLAERTIREQCYLKWFGDGLAKQSPKGWLIREDADARFSRCPSPRDLPADLKQLTTDQRKLVLWKKGLLEEHEGFTNADDFRGMSRDQADDYFLQALAMGRLAVQLPTTMKTPGVRTLRRWQGQFKAGGLAALVDGRGLRYRDEPGEEDPFFQLFKELYLVQQKPSLRFCWQMACFEAVRRGIMIRSEPQTRRFEKTIAAAVKSLFRGGDKAYNDQSSPYIPRDYSSLRVNQVFVADHHQFDVVVTHQGKQVRAWLTAFADARSRKIVGWHISPDGGNTDTILAAMVEAIDSAGAPEQVYLDWGKDFSSRAIGSVGRKQRMAGKPGPIDEAFGPSSICGALGIKVIHCQPYHGQSKPIERNFGTMRSFTKTRSTYCGSKPADRPENLPAKLGRGAPELADFIESFGGWVRWYNECNAHQGDSMDGRTPAQVFDALRIEKRVIPDEVRLLLGWKPSPLVNVGRNGARFGGLTYALDDRSWMAWQGKQVTVRVDPTNISRAAICSPEGRFLCMGAAVDKLPWDATAEQKSAAIAAIKRRKKLVREYHQQRPKLANSVADEMWSAQAEKSRRQREAAGVPVPLVTVSTPMNDQCGEIGKALVASGPRLSYTASDTPAIPRITDYVTSDPELSDFAKRGRMLEDEQKREENREATDDAFLLFAKVFGNKPESES